MNGQRTVSSAPGAAAPVDPELLRSRGPASPMAGDGTTAPPAPDSTQVSPSGGPGADRTSGSNPNDVGGQPPTERVKAAVDEAGGQAKELVAEGRTQAQELAGEARRAVRHRVDERSSQVAGGLARLADELECMAGAAGRQQDQSMLAQPAQRLASMARHGAERLEREGPDGMVDDVRRFARQRPAIFLGAAFGVGILAGRFLRGDIDHHREQAPSSNGSGNGASTHSGSSFGSSQPVPTYDQPGLTAGADPVLPHPGATPADRGLVQGGPTAAGSEVLP